MTALNADTQNHESRLSALEARSASNATKEDLANLKVELIKWFSGTQIALAALIIYLLQ